MSGDDRVSFVLVWLGFWLCVPAIFLTLWWVWSTVSRYSGLREVLKVIALVAATVVGAVMLWSGISMKAGL